MANLAEADGMAAKAVCFTYLTAGRSGKIRNAVWPEIDLAAKIWTVPASRMKTGKEVTVHGLRSTFRDWAAEETDYPREVAEMALAHAISDKVEAAYRRGDLCDKRREMITEWCAVQQST